jgi:hypothetical protein
MAKPSAPSARRPLYTRQVWVTKEGERIRVRDLTDRHLRNILRFLRPRALQRWVLESLDPSIARGDMAQMAEEEARRELERMGPTQFVAEVMKIPTIYALIREAERRFTLSEVDTLWPDDAWTQNEHLQAIDYAVRSRNWEHFEQATERLGATLDDIAPTPGADYSDPEETPNGK